MANPSFDECRCNIASRRGTNREAEARKIHEMLLEIDSEPVAAIATVLVAIEDETVFFGEEIETFIAQHNWHDPVAMRDLAETFDVLLTRSQKSNDEAIALMDECQRRLTTA
jgi:hypothetical protein